MAGGAVRAERASATRELILHTAERLFAEHGVNAVSNRQISEAAGQGNNAAVNYHFGTKVDLVRAIAHKHGDQVEQRRLRMLAEIDGDSRNVRDWVACLVRPSMEHLAGLPGPTWFARFNAQVMTDPLLREIVVDDLRAAASVPRILAGLDRCLPQLPAEVRTERDDMVRQLMVHMVAERERALADGRPTPRATWQDAADGMIDALAGLWLAPVTSH